MWPKLLSCHEPFLDMVKEKVVGCICASSACSLGEDKDSITRQKQTIAEYAHHHNSCLEQYFQDPAASGTDPIDGRPGFHGTITHCLEHNIKVIVFEDNRRLARDMIAQEWGCNDLDWGSWFKLVSASNPAQSQEQSLTTTFIRQILGAVSEFERGTLVQRLEYGRWKHAQRTNERTLKPKPGTCGVKSSLATSKGEAITSSVEEIRKESRVETRPTQWSCGCPCNKRHQCAAWKFHRPFSIWILD